VIGRKDIKPGFAAQQKTAGQMAGGFVLKFV
jgi:hypothetical protein